MMLFFILNITVLCIVAASYNYVGTNYDETEVRGIIENTINTTLNRIKANLTDPIVIPVKSFDFGEGESISGGFNISSCKINGVKDFVAKEIKVHVLSQKINMKMALTELNLHLKYWADILLLNLVPIYGQGRMDVSFDEIEVNVQAAASVKESPKIKDIVLLFSLSEATFNLNGLIDNPEYSSLISNILTDNYANFVNRNSRVISDSISPILETLINSLLEPTSEKIHVKEMSIYVNTLK